MNMMILVRGLESAAAKYFLVIRKVKFRDLAVKGDSQINLKNNIWVCGKGT